MTLDALKLAARPWLGKLAAGVVVVAVGLAVAAWLDARSARADLAECGKRAASIAGELATANGTVATLRSKGLEARKAAATARAKAEGRVSAQVGEIEALRARVAAGTATDCESAIRRIQEANP